MATITSWRPRRVPEAAATFARTVVCEAAPSSPARAKALLFATSRLAVFATEVGLDLDVSVVLHPAVIERFVAVATTGMSSPTRRTVRTNLRHVAQRVGPARRPRPAVLPRERIKTPYTDAEVDAYLRLADTQPTLGRRMRTVGLIGLGAGAGLTGGDLRSVRGTDIVGRSGGMVVVVSGPRARVVPVAVRYQQRLAVVASFFGSELIIGRDLSRRNVTTALIDSLAGGADLCRLDTRRLRSTWLAACATTIGLKAFMTAAGVACTQRLGDLVASLPDIDETDAVTILGAAR